MNYLSKNSCLDHCYHPRQQSESILGGQKDMASGDFDLLTLLCSVNVSPMQICQIMEQVKGPEGGHISQNVSMIAIREQRIFKILR